MTCGARECIHIRVNSFSGMDLVHYAVNQCYITSMSWARAVISAEAGSVLDSDERPMPSAPFQLAPLASDRSPSRSMTPSSHDDDEAHDPLLGRPESPPRRKSHRRRRSKWAALAQDIFYYLIRQRWFPTRPPTIVRANKLVFLANYFIGCCRVCARSVHHGPRALDYLLCQLVQDGASLALLLPRNGPVSTSKLLDTCARGGLSRCPDGCLGL